MTLVTRDLILTPIVRRYIEKDTRIGRVRLRSLTDKEKCQLDATTFDGNGKLRKDQMMARNARLIAAMVVDAEGNRVFCDSDVAKIQELECGVVVDVAAECEAHLAGDAPKNGEETPGDSLLCGSHSS